MIKAKLLEINKKQVYTVFHSLACERMLHIKSLNSVNSGREGFLFQTLEAL